MREKVMISVIVPVYNAEQYLRKCVDSILTQSYPNLEVILVDDGSTDTSGNICDGYQSNDARVRVLHKINGGNTSARKAGLESAVGEYVAFVDSDDWIAQGMYEQLMSLAQRYHTDIVESSWYLDYGYTCVVKESSLSPGLYEHGKNYQVLIDNLMRMDGKGRRPVAYSLCNKLLRRDVIYEIMRNENTVLQYGEDAICIYQMVLKSTRIYVTESAFYHYRMHGDSITHKRDDKYFTKINEFFLEAKRILAAYPEYKGTLMPQLGLQMAQMAIKGLSETFDFGIDVYFPAYIMPEMEIPKGSRIILYGAGRVGKDFYRSLNDSGNYRLVAWLDGNAEPCRKNGSVIEPPEAIREYEFDYVILAALRESTAESMRGTLDRMGIDRDKMVWIKPREVLQVKNPD